jgi:hypothetical protein
VTLLVPELNRILSRVFAISSDPARLKIFFEKIGLELAEGPGLGQRMEMAGAGLPEGPVRMWNAFTLGRRAQADVRISLVGTTFDDLAEHPGMLEVADALLFDLPQDLEGVETLLRLPVSLEARNKPVVLLGLNEGLSNDPVRAFKRKALTAWFHRHFGQTNLLAPDGKTFPKALEWVLSF